MVQCLRTCSFFPTIWLNHSPAMHAGEWRFKTTHKKGERRKQALQKGAWSSHTVLNQEFHTWLSSPPSFSSALTYRNSAVLYPIPKALPLLGLATFSHASFHNGKTLFQEHARGDGSQLSFPGIRNSKLPSGQIGRELCPFIWLIPPDYKLMFMLGSRHGKFSIIFPASSKY
jgi:hypothetical protein